MSVSSAFKEFSALKELCQDSSLPYSQQLNNGPKVVPQYSRAEVKKIKKKTIFMGTGETSVELIQTNTVEFVWRKWGNLRNMLFISDWVPVKIRTGQLPNEPESLPLH